MVSILISIQKICQDNQPTHVNKRCIHLNLEICIKHILLKNIVIVATMYIYDYIRSSRFPTILHKHNLNHKVLIQHTH